MSLAGHSACRHREDDQTVAFRGSKSRNKVSVGEPAEGSLLVLLVQYRTHFSESWRQKSSVVTACFYAAVCCLPKTGGTWPSGVVGWILRFPSCRSAGESWPYARAGETSPVRHAPGRRLSLPCQSRCEGWRWFKELVGPQALAAPLAIFFVTYRKHTLVVEPNGSESCRLPSLVGARLSVLC